MPNNWKTYKLEELTTKIGDGLHGTPKYSNKGEYYFINGNNLTNGKIEIKKDTKKITYEEFLKHKKDLNKNTIFVSINGTIGNVGTYNGEQVILGKSACYFNIKDSVNKEFIKQVFSSKLAKDYLENNATGTTIKNVSLKTIREFPINLPPLEEQKSIATILSTIDNKIENNLAVNKTLEEMAMALYKHWFVDFGPFQDGEFVDSELGKIPEGWEVKSVYDVCEVIYGAPFKSKLFNETKEGFPLIRIRDLKTFKPQYYTEENHPKKSIIKAGDLVAGMDAEFDPYFWLGEDGVLNQRVVHFKPKVHFSRMFIFYSVLPWLKFYAGAKVGTTVIHLGKSDIDNFKLAVPSNLNSIISFNEQSEKFLEQVVNNSKENQTLTQLRDTLLPKLISGEVRLKEFVSSEE